MIHKDIILMYAFPHLPDEEVDKIMVQTVAQSMTDKLARKRKEGRGGWHTSKCSDESLRAMLIDHIEKGDMIDVINFAGMIYMREQIFGSGS